MKKSIAYFIVACNLLSLSACNAIPDSERHIENTSLKFEEVTVSPTGIPEPTRIPMTTPYTTAEVMPSGTVEATLDMCVTTPLPTVPMDPPAPTPAVCDMEGEYDSYSVWFPQTVSMGNENTEVPLRCDFVLPDGCTIKTIDAVDDSVKYLATHTLSRYFIMNADGECIGAFGYKKYSPVSHTYNYDKPKYWNIYRDVFEESDISSFQYERDYHALLTNAHNESAVTTVLTDKWLAEEYTGINLDICNDGVLSYNDNFRTIIAFEFIRDKLSENQLHYIAYSICFDEC